MQLPPVNKNSNSTNISSTFTHKNSYELTEIVRQDSDNPLIKLLEIVVNDIRTEDSKFITYLLKNPIQINSNGEGYKVYTNQHEFLNQAIETFKKEEFAKDPDFARVAAWKNDTVMGYNIAIRNQLIPYFSGPDSEKELIDVNDLLIGYTTITDEFNDIVLTNSEDYVIKSITPRIADHGFKLYVARIAPRHGGREVDINIVDYRDKSFLVYYDRIKQKYFQALYAKAYERSSKWKSYFDYKNMFLSLITFPIKEGDIEKTWVSKDIDYAFALTVHKLQGSTIKNVFVDLNDMLFYKNGSAVMNATYNPKAIEIRNKLIYTAFSRTSEICNIYLNIK